MSLFETGVVDLITTDKRLGRAQLDIIYPQSWGDQSRFIESLGPKLNTYVQFIKSGEMERRYPATAGLDIVITIVCPERPPEWALNLLSVAGGKLKRHGIDLRVRIEA
ncbi:MAG: hypothetical protein QNJ98_09665 [Planctomycetota bacterium]|nr:hypothetical protein [Planctomycetota bacterium]